MNSFKWKSGWTAGVMAGIALTIDGCRTFDKPTGPLDKGSEVIPMQADPYPIDPKVHLESAGNPLDPGSYEKFASNSVAYARYALSLAEGVAWDTVETPSLMLDGFFDFARRFQLDPAIGLKNFIVETNSEEGEVYRAHLNDRLDGEGLVPKLSKQNLQVLTAKKQVKVCHESSGLDESACCQNLLLPWALWGAYSDQDPEQKAKVTQGMENGSTYGELRSILVGDGEGNPFQLLGIKAWLSACNGALTHAPPNLRGLGEHLNYSESHSPWRSSLHPTSRAKFAGRRIYRNSKVDVSIAESLGKDCKVIETEIVQSGPGLSKIFWTFDKNGDFDDTGLFPDQRGGQVIKHTPESCMGCHYTFDKRHFSVVAPSYNALHLQPREVGGQPNWRDDSQCRRPGEPLIFHPDVP